MTKIKHRFWISAPIDKVYSAISTIAGVKEWWTSDTTGIYSVGGRLRFGFADGKHNLFEVTKLEKNKSVAWKCVESAFPDQDWLGTTVTISLSRDEDGDIVVDFEHDGWAAMNDFYGICNWHWGFFLNSLKQYCETGEGMPE